MIASLKQFLALPVFEDEEQTRKAALLNTLTLASFFVLTLYLIAQTLLQPGANSFWVWVRYPLVVATWLLLRFGYVHLACAFGVSSAWAVQMIVWSRSGHITVYSELGHGTTFKIYLPVAEAEEALAFPERKAITQFKGNETVLLVETKPLCTESAEVFCRTESPTQE
jgi:hypothetical protein